MLVLFKVKDLFNKVMEFVKKLKVNFVLGYVLIYIVELVDVYNNFGIMKMVIDEFLEVWRFLL